MPNSCKCFSTTSCLLLPQLKNNNNFGRAWIRPVILFFLFLNLKLHHTTSLSLAGLDPALLVRGQNSPQLQWEVRSEAFLLPITCSWPSPGCHSGQLPVTQLGLSSKRSWPHSPRTQAGGKGEGREKLILVWKMGQGQIWVTSAPARRSVDNSDSLLPRRYSGWAVPDSGFQGGRQHDGSLAVLMLIWAALVLRPLDLPFSLCAYEHVRPLSRRDDFFFFYYE